MTSQQRQLEHQRKRKCLLPAHKPFTHTSRLQLDRTSTQLSRCSVPPKKRELGALVLGTKCRSQASIKGRGYKITEHSPQPKWPFVIEGLGDEAAGHSTPASPHPTVPIYTRSTQSPAPCSAQLPGPGMKTLALQVNWPQNLSRSISVSNCGYVWQNLKVSPSRSKDSHVPVRAPLGALFFLDAAISARAISMTLQLSCQVTISPSIYRSCWRDFKSFSCAGVISFKFFSGVMCASWRHISSSLVSSRIVSMSSTSSHPHATPACGQRPPAPDPSANGRRHRSHHSETASQGRKRGHPRRRVPQPRFPRRSSSEDDDTPTRKRARRDEDFDRLNDGQSDSDDKSSRWVHTSSHALLNLSCGLR